MEDQEPLEIHQHDVAPSDSHLENNDEVMCFREFSYSDLKTATKNFSSDEIVSEKADESSNIIYKGESQSFGSIAVKYFKNMAWPDRDHFAEEARKVGKIRHKGVVKMIGCCCDGDERFLVAEFLPNDTLAPLRIAYQIAEALDHCSTVGFTSYNNLNAYTVLFDEEGDACLSCFGLMKERKDDQSTTGSVVNPESMTYRFGYFLLTLLTGKQIPLDLSILEKDVIELMDPNLEGELSTEEATIVFSLASQCLQYNDRLNITELTAKLELLQNKAQEEGASSSPQEQLAPLQRPPTKPATRVAGFRRSVPRRKQKTTPIQSDEEIQAQNREKLEQMQMREVQKAKNQLEKPKAKNKMGPSKPGQSTKPRRNQF